MRAAFYFKKLIKTIQPSNQIQIEIFDFLYAQELTNKEYCGNHGQIKLTIHDV